MSGGRKLLTLVLALMLILGLACPGCSALAEEGSAALPEEGAETPDNGGEVAGEAGIASPEEGAETPDNGGEPEVQAIALPDGYEQIAENGRFRLYLKRDTLAIIVESVQSGKLLYSTVQNPDEMKDNATWKGFYQSGVVMEYLDGVKTIPVQADFINTESQIDLTLTGDGYVARVTYPEISIGYEVTLKMDERGFSVSIPKEKIVEDDSDNFTVSSFYVYPFMGYSYLGQNEGYMIIPDGQGAIIELKDNEERFSSPFDLPVYGTNIGVESSVYSDWSVDAEQVLLRRFGQVDALNAVHAEGSGQRLFDIAVGDDGIPGAVGLDEYGKQLPFVSPDHLLHSAAHRRREEDVRNILVRHHRRSGQYPVALLDKQPRHKALEIGRTDGDNVRNNRLFGLKLRPSIDREVEALFQIELVRHYT